ncbi:MAG TPA: hypothetical protein VI756_24470, partial [Blastocatellia bacterium]
MQDQDTAIPPEAAFADNVDVRTESASPFDEYQLAVDRRVAGQSGREDLIRVRSAHLWLPLAISLSIAAAYLSTVAFGFVYDDEGQILANPLIRSWRHIPDFFTRNVWGFDPTSGANYYRPVFLLWLFVNRFLFGLHPGPWHLAAVGLHIVCALLVYGITLKLGRNLMLAAATGLIFALHPVHIQAVAWISGANESLMAVFLLLAYACYLNSSGIFGEGSGRSKLSGGGWAILSTAMYGLALLTKETAIIFPIIVLGTGWIYGRKIPTVGRSFLFGLKRALPYAALAVIYCLVHILVLGFPHAVTSLSKLSLLYTWPGVAWSYVRLLLWPVGLSLLYTSHYLAAFEIRQVLAPAAAIILLAAMILFCCRRYLTGDQRRLAGVAALWMVLPMLPLADLRFLPQDQVIQDRYLYLPSIGFSLLVAIAVTKISGRGPVLFGQPARLVLAVAVLSVFLGALTASQAIYWANDLL